MITIKWKMYMSFVGGIVCILIGAYYIVASTDKKAADAFFTLGIISHVYAVFLLFLMRRLKSN